MKCRHIAVPGIGITDEPYFYGTNLKEPAGYSLWFVIWDQAEQGADWLHRNARQIVSNLNNSEEYEDDTPAFDLHKIDPRYAFLEAIDFAELKKRGELCVTHDHEMDEWVYWYHQLWVRRVADEYILNGGWSTTYMDEELPSEWSEVTEQNAEDFFQLRVPADLFEAEYRSAVELFYRERLQEKACKPDSRAWIKRLSGEFTKG